MADADGDDPLSAMLDAAAAAAPRSAASDFDDTVPPPPLGSGAASPSVVDDVAAVVDDATAAQIDDLMEELEGLMEPSAEVADDDGSSEIESGIVISPFAASGNDGGVTANLKLVLGSRDGEGLERSLANGAESMRDVAVRSALTALLQSGSAAARLDARTYLNLVHLLEAAMKLVLEQNDLDNAIVLLDMINVYYRLEKSGKNHFLSQEEVLRRSPLWQSLRFWKATVFEATAKKRAELGGQEESWSEMNEGDRLKREEAEQSIAFTQVSKIVTQMLDFGGVTIEEIIKFHLEMTGELEVITNPQHVEALNRMVNQAAYHHVMKKPDGSDYWQNSPYNHGQTHDEFGFVIEDYNTYVLEQRHKESNKDQFDKRAAVWKAWDPDSADSDAFQKALAKGVPHAERRVVWKTMTEEIRQTICTYRGGMSYTDLVQQVASAAEPSKIAGTIELDLDRTFPGHQLIDTDEGRDKLRRILVSYSVRNPEVGYCQSMNYIAAALMVVLEEEDAFWFLSMVEERILEQYHSAHILGVRTDCRLLLNLVEVYMPQLCKHLTENQIVPEVAFIQWFMCMFVNSLPFEVVMRVWDYMYGTAWRQEKAKSAQSNDIIVTFPVGARIGLQFPRDVTPLVIGQIGADGLAAQNPALVPGLVLRTVQGQSIAGLSYAETMEKMRDAKKAGRPLRLTFTTSTQVDAPRDIMLRVGLAVIHTLQRPLYAAQTSQEVNQVLRNGVGKIVDADELLRIALNPRWRIDPNLREKHKSEIQLENQRVSDSRHQREQDAADRLRLNRASDRLGTQMHKGSEEDERVVKAAGTCILKLVNNDVHRGSLFLTNYRLAFVSEDLPKADENTIIDIPLISIFKIVMKRALKLSTGYDLGAVVLKVVSKDCRILCFLFEISVDRPITSLLNATVASKSGDAVAKKESSALARLIQHKHLSVTASSNALMKMFSGKDELVPQTAQENKVWGFLRATRELIDKSVQMKYSFQLAPTAKNDDNAYDAPAEYARLKALDADSGWRHCSLNQDHKLCATYPYFIVVPNAISDAEVEVSAAIALSQRLRQVLVRSGFREDWSGRRSIYHVMSLCGVARVSMRAQ